MEDYKKKYEAAIKQAKEELKTCGSLDCDVARQIFRFFPELKESEDEKIMKDLIGYFEVCDNTTFAHHRVSDIISCLEKQVSKEETLKEHNICDTCEESNGCVTPCCAKLLEKQGEQSPADKVEPKFKVGDTIIEKDLDECSCGTIVNIKDDKYIFDNGCFIRIKEQEGWQLVKTPTTIEQKPAWSEEDEKMLNDIIVGLTSMEQLIFTHDVQGKTQIQGRIDWLKSLKERMKGE